jgi:hypothetical protein
VRNRQPKNGNGIVSARRGTSAQDFDNAKMPAPPFTTRIIATKGVTRVAEVSEMVGLALRSPNYAAENLGASLKVASISIAAMYISDAALADDEADAVKLLKESFKRRQP